MAGRQYGASTGLQGGWDAFNQILAKQDILKQREFQRQQQELMNQRALEDRALREREFAAREQDRAVDNARLDRAEAAQSALRGEQEKEKRAASEREAQRIAQLERVANDPSADPMVRRQAALLLMTGGKSIPAEALRDREAEHRRQVVEINLRDHNRANRDAANDQRDIARDKAKAERDDPKKPRGVSEYLLKLKTKYSTIDDAIKELDSAWDSITKAHPNADAAAVVNELRGMYARPAGVRSSGITIDEKALAGR